ncbi:MAG TPA: type II secretion system F family protein [Gemmatimonadaceae bacterium]|nr:type II secretion system F family protein [Gemmatimonadaceae bacterium]
MILVLIAIFLATLAVIVGGYVFVNRRTLAESDIARTRLQKVEIERTWKLLKEVRSSDLGFIERILTGQSWVEGLTIQLQRAGTDLKPGAFVLMVATSGFAATFLAARMESLMLGLVVALFGWAAPFLWLRWRKRRLLNAFENQLPDAIDMLVSAMKAGYSFQAATQFIGEELIAPAGPEFARFYDEQRLGIEVRQALLNLQDRMDSLDLKMFVTAVLIQRETGGNLGDVLGNLADLIRGRIAMRGHIQTLVAEPKMSARFLAILPVIVFFLLKVVSPNFVQPLTENPSGRLMLGSAIIMVVIGYFVMMKIADVDI